MTDTRPLEEPIRQAERTCRGMDEHIKKLKQAEEELQRSDSLAAPVPTPADVSKEPHLPGLG
jgi:hypothetical protein